MRKIRVVTKDHLTRGCPVCIKLIDDAQYEATLLDTVMAIEELVIVAPDLGPDYTVPRAWANPHPEDPTPVGFEMVR